MLRPTSPQVHTRALPRVAGAALALALLSTGCSMLPRTERPGHQPDAPIVSAQPVAPATRTTLQAPSATAAPAAPAPAPTVAAPSSPAPVVVHGPSSGTTGAAATPPAAASGAADSGSATASVAAVTPPRPAISVSPITPPAPGLYRCDADRRAIIRRVSDDGQRIVLGWAGADHQLVAARAASGAAIRWQDTRSGLAWIVAEGHALLLDLRQGRTLAADCRL